MESGASRQIWVMNGDGSGKKQLPTRDLNENPNWSPDGRRIVFDSDRAETGNLDVYSMLADGSDVRRMTESPALDALPAYSPDRKQIVCVSDRALKDSRKLYVMPAGGGDARQGDRHARLHVPDGHGLAAAAAEGSVHDSRHDARRRAHRNRPR